MAQLEHPLPFPVGADTGASIEGVRRRFTRLPWTAFVIIVIMVTVAILAPVLAPHSPTEQSLPDKLKPPAWQEGGSSKHLLGTDILGRDMLSRLIYGARVSLTVAACALPSATVPSC